MLYSKMGLKIRAIVLILLFCGCADSTSDQDAGIIFQPELSQPPKFDVGGQDTNVSSQTVTNECGEGCAVGTVCSYCFIDKVLKCAVPGLGESGSSCTSGDTCKSKKCLAPQGGAQGRCAVPCTVDAPGICGLPGEACLGPEGQLCTDVDCHCGPSPCGARHSICSSPGGCSCQEGLDCKLNSIGFETCESDCKADEDCPKGYRCDKDDTGSACTPLGPRPATSPCREDTDCESNKCSEIAGTTSLACLAACTGCSVCPAFSNGCGVVFTQCKDGLCQPIKSGDVGALCSDEMICLTEGQSEGAVPTLSCVKVGGYGRCSKTCTEQADCSEFEICRTGALLSVANETASYCMAKVSNGVGDCCSLTNRCTSDDSECVVDAGDLVCALPCNKQGQCPSGYQCADTFKANGDLGRYCVTEVIQKTSEICNGEDDDLDGFIDNAPGGGPLLRSCYTGPGASLGVGICKGGIRECLSGVWSDCQGQVTPIMDGPNGPAGCDNADNDCDGGVDEGCPCAGPPKPCGLNKGACQSGVQICLPEFAVWSNCEWGVGGTGWPEPELCDGIDNDCDGGVDNMPGQNDPLEMSCGDFNHALDGVGICHLGKKTCEGECLGAVGPVEEVCDDLDNDCDGVTDENCECTVGKTQTCGTGLGVCTVGVQACEGGNWGTECINSIPVAVEQCDNLDNDCDGRVDNQPGATSALTESCWDVLSDVNALQVGLGSCKAGQRMCLAGGWATCHNQVVPAADPSAPKGDQCGDEIDNNCNGATDEGCPCDDSDGLKSCGSSVGQCALGLQTCTNNVWSDCVGGVPPVIETCNGLDDNCDGLTDQLISGATLSVTCYTGPPLTAGQGQCHVGQAVCSTGAFGECQSQVLPETEFCNDLDDDCDGVADEGLDCGCKADELRPCGLEQGVCTTGVSLCEKGQWGALCLGANTPSLEKCNGLDDDCDGLTDQNYGSGAELKGQCYSGPDKTRDIGTCKSGTRICANSQWTQCIGEVLPKTESCDGADNDCDGVIDEGCSCTDGAKQPCSVNAGVCQVGEQKCIAGQWSGLCSGVLPQSETCNGLDDDCDGTTDIRYDTQEPLTETCYDGTVGTQLNAPCQPGVRYCSNGSYAEQKCHGQRVPAPKEICANSLDDNCNGVVDADCD